MKNKVYILFIVIFGVLTTSYGQADTIDCDSKIDTLTGMDIYPYPDEEPTPTGGNKQLYDELTKLNIRGKCLNIDSRLFVAFIVDVNGEIKGKRVIKDIEGTDFAEQVLKLIDNIEWNPAVCQGEQVPAIRMVTVRVYL